MDFLAAFAMNEGEGSHVPLMFFFLKNVKNKKKNIYNQNVFCSLHIVWVLYYIYTYGSVSAGQEKWPFNVLFFFKVEPPCDQT